MGENSAIEWTDHTFNPWVGCTKVSPGCDHCYAETQMVRRKFVEWGPSAERRRTSASNWHQPLKWNREAERTGVRRKVFCASLADVFDNQVPAEWRADLWRLIEETPHLDWLLLTKRPSNIARALPVQHERAGPGYLHPWRNKWPWPNVWLGTTVENQAEADRRIPQLLAVPASKRFLSCEPLLGPVGLSSIARPIGLGTYQFNVLTGQWHNRHGGLSEIFPIQRIDWVIAGGESGPNARPMHPDWARSLRDQCAAAGVPFHFKQWGEWGLEDSTRRTEPHAIANDGTLYKQADLAYPDGARRGEAIRADHDRAHLHSIYRVGKKAAGALLDGREWREMPDA